MPSNGSGSGSGSWTAADEAEGDQRNPAERLDQRAEVLATDYDGMIAQAKIFTAIGKNIAVKVPLTWDGLKACKALSDQGTPRECHALLFGGAGDDGGQGGRVLHFAPSSDG